MQMARKVKVANGWETTGIDERGHPANRPPTSRLSVRHLATGGVGEGFYPLPNGCPHQPLLANVSALLRKDRTNLHIVVLWYQNTKIAFRFWYPHLGAKARHGRECNPAPTKKNSGGRKYNPAPIPSKTGCRYGKKTPMRRMGFLRRPAIFEPLNS